MNPGRRRGSIAGRFLAGVFVLGSIVPSAAQVVDCESLRRRIAALGRGDGGQASRYTRSMRRQQIEIDRTMAYRRSRGCDRRQFLVFGEAPPADCSQIDARIDRMNANLAALQETAARVATGDPDERGELVQRYSVYCREQDRFAAVGPRGYPERFPPDDEGPQTGFQRMPIDPDRDDPDARGEGGDATRPAETETPEQTGEIGGAKAVCVKTCDGSFFPVSYSASRGNLASLEAMCHATCPNAETKLYTLDMAAEISQAVDKQGVSYAELPAANRYTKKYDAACSCRAPGKSWLETLVEAEKLYAGGQHDVVVTQQMSDALARAAPAVASTLPPRSRKRGSQRPVNAAEGATERAAIAASDSASAAAAATDLAPGSLRGTAAPGANEPTHAVSGKRRVRVIAPNL